jgi:RNA polymerase sigma factor (sigma-70 family)
MSHHTLILTDILIQELQITIDQFLYYRGVPRDLIDDMVQEIWVLILNKKDQLKDPRFLKAWCLKITQNYLYETVRAKKYKQRNQTHALESFDMIKDDRLFSPLEQMIQSEKTEVLYHSIQMLSVDIQQMIFFQIDGYSLAEIKAELSLNLSQIKNKLLKGRKHLRHYLKYSTKIEQWL